MLGSLPLVSSCCAYLTAALSCPLFAEYWLKTQTFTRKSTVTETEDVSYVSSAYVPQCLRHGGRPTLSNAHRAHECNTSDSNIRDELDEVITLNSVSIIVAEYVPCGANQIVQLNENLGSTERVQGGFFTALIDEDSSGTKFEVPPGLTSVNILDYTLTNHINFEADIHFPEEEGIVQVETFGVSINADGTIFYGMQIEAVMDRIKDNISLDHLSRLLVDVQQDSSKIVDSVISLYQRALLELIFCGDAENRDKVNLIIANEITPHLTAEEYMDKGEYENELKQVLGDTRAAFDISEHDTLIFGAHGILVAGPNSRHHEPLLCSYLQFISMDIFVRNFFARMFVTLDKMKNCREKIDTYFVNPNSLNEIRDEMAVLYGEQIRLEEILGYLEESLATMLIPPEPPEQAGRSLYERLQISDMKAQLLRRVKDLVKNLGGSRHELEVLQEMSAIVSEKIQMNTQSSVDTSLKNLCSLSKSGQKSQTALEAVSVILIGSLTFDILDRLTGDWTVVNTTWMRGFVEPLIRNTPFVWFIISMVLWFAIAIGLTKWMASVAHKHRGVISLRITYQKPINVEALNAYVSARSNKMIYETRSYELDNDIVKMRWFEKDKRDWGGTAPEIEVEYDEKHSYMLRMTLQYSKRFAKKNLSFNAQELKTRLFQDFKAANIFVDDDDDDDEKGGDVDFG